MQRDKGELDKASWRGVGLRKGYLQAGLPMKSAQGRGGGVACRVIIPLSFGIVPRIRRRAGRGRIASSALGEKFDENPPILPRTRG